MSENVLHAPVVDATIAGGENAIGPHVDLTGYTDYRLVLSVAGTAGTSFVINEMFSAVGIGQFNANIHTDTVGASGSVLIRKKFEVFGPKSVAIRIINLGKTPIKAKGSLYAVKPA